MRDLSRQSIGWCPRAQRFIWRGWVVIIQQEAKTGTYLVWPAHDTFEAPIFWVTPASVAPHRWCPAEVARTIMHELRLYGVD